MLNYALKQLVAAVLVQFQCIPLTVLLKYYFAPGMLHFIIYDGYNYTMLSVMLLSQCHIIFYPALHTLRVVPAIAISCFVIATLYQCVSLVIYLDIIKLQIVGCCL